MLYHFECNLQLWFVSKVNKYASQPKQLVNFKTFSRTFITFENISINNWAYYEEKTLLKWLICFDKKQIVESTLNDQFGISQDDTFYSKYYKKLF